MTLQGKKILITGAYGGLGRAMCEEFLLAGNSVALVGRDWNKLLKLKNELLTTATQGQKIEFYVCELSDSESVLKMTSAVKNDFDHIDVIINAAAIFPVSSIENTTTKDFQDCMKVNVESPFVIIREFLEGMKESKWGRIVNIASSSAYGGAPKTSAYCASKHALLGLSRTLFKELKQDGVRVYCISPGSIQTPMGEEVEKLGQIYDTFMTPQDVAKYTHHVISYDGQMISEEVRLNRMFVQ